MPTIDRDFVIATVAAPTVMKEPEKPAEKPAEGAEGETPAEGAEQLQKMEMQLKKMIKQKMVLKKNLKIKNLLKKNN